MVNGFPTELEKKYTRFNNLAGWLVFLISAGVYWFTIEPTASFWDCSEFIAADYKLQTPHPPGAPFLQLVAHLVSLLSFGNVHKVALYVNRVSAVCSALTIMFLFWTITYFAKRAIKRDEELTEGKMYAVLGSGLIGSLAFTFTDSFWFSAVEGEVYAMSSCFTAMVFWCILKWERAKASPERWLVLTFYLVGLSIGVHLLCLLTLPAVVFIYYFKRFPNGINQDSVVSKLLSFITKNPKMQGALVAGIAAVALLGGIQSLIIPGIIQLAAYFEIFFVNTAQLHFESGTMIYAATLALLIILALFFTHKKNLPGWNTAVLAFTMLLIGYSSFLILVVRANANTPMNENDPSNAVHLHAYLGRQQYGDWPLVYGQYYTAPLDAQKPYKDGNPVYEKDTTSGRYIVTNDMKGEVANYDSKFCTWFPRMWDAGESHPQGYRNWGGTDFDSIEYVDANKKSYHIPKPAFTDNLRYFIRYQVNFMFWRYFMWNFCGRQNDIQGNDDADNLHGNWITGIPFIDRLIYPQQNMPAMLSDNKGRNPMYGLPLLLGLLGLFYQYRKDKENALVVGILFFFTGLAIILYLNQTPYQPRERDYSYVGAFYAFAIWIGLGVLDIFELLHKFFARMNQNTMAVTATVFSMVVPVVMACAEWNDHDRSKRYTCRDMAINYLESCAPNAILFTNGDNDTFPLWYAQEVEGIRTDVRVCNLNLLASSWYIDQMKRRVYNSAPVPFSMTHNQYRDGTREYVPVLDNKRGEGYTDLKELMDFVKSDSISNQVAGEGGKHYNYFPTDRFEIKTNREVLLKTNAVPVSLQDSILPVLDWKMPGDYVLKNTLMVLDLLANNNWERPVYFGVSTGSEAYIGLEPYLQLEGMTYRLVPVKNNTGMSTRVATDIMYNNVMHRFKWGIMHAKIYLDENIRGMANDLRIELMTLAQALIKENKNDSALKVLNLCIDSIPEESCPYASATVMAVYGYYELTRFTRANAIAKEMFNQNETSLTYYNTLSAISQQYYMQDMVQMQVVMERLTFLAKTYAQDDVYKEFSERLNKLQQSGIIQK